MNLARGIDALPEMLKASAVTIGNFDGVHRGHQALLDAVLKESWVREIPSVAVTFDPHPVSVLAPEKGFHPLFGRDDLVEQMEKRGLDYLILQPFTKEFARLSPEVFIRELVVPWLHPDVMVVGHDFAFGNHRQGSLEILQQLGKRERFEVIEVAPVKGPSGIISSTLIRKAVAEGDVALAAELLGRPFAIRGEVINGDGRGRRVGIPTANLEVSDVQLPKQGVYVTETVAGGVASRSVTNVGTAPTFGDNGRCRIETHLLDQNVSLYGSHIEVRFLSYLRGEKKFQSVDELVAQIRRDIEAARNFKAGQA